MFDFTAIDLSGTAGLVAMVLLSLLPIGLMQTWASVTHGLWYARSAEFLQQPALRTLRWLRAPGDVVFSLGVVSLAIFVARLAWASRHHVHTAEQEDGAEAKPAKAA